MKKSKDEPELAASACGILSWLPHRYEISSSQLLKQEWFDQVVLEIEMASLHPKSLKPDSRQAAQVRASMLGSSDDRYPPIQLRPSIFGPIEFRE